MPQILFGQSYYLRFDPKLYAAMQPYPPLGTLYAASYVRQQGYSVALFDAMLAESEAEWAAALALHRPTYAVLYEDNFNYLSKMCLLAMRQAAFVMIKLAQERGCTVIVCGSDAADQAEAYLQAGADYVLLGEGEETLVALLDGLNGRSPHPLADILGLAYRHEGHPRRNPRRPPMTTIDHLPFPAWDLVDVPRYRQIWQQRHGYYAMNMVTTRGCPYHCNWCAKPIWGQRYAARSPENVVQELKWLKESYQPDYISFADDIMGLKPGWWQTFAELVTVANVRTPFKCLTRADLLLRQAQDIPNLHRAGCDIVWMGAESGSQEILNAMEKGTTVAQIYEATRQLHAAQIKVGFFLQFGYPGETWADVQKTLQMVRDCQPDDIGVSVSYPLPGTKFYENVRQQLGDKQNWVDSADLEMLYQGPFATAFYRQLHHVLHQEFRARRVWLAFRGGGAWPGVGRLLAALYRYFTLPLTRWQLRRLAVQSSGGLRPMPHMPPGEAAQPSPQQE